MPEAKEAVETEHALGPELLYTHCLAELIFVCRMHTEMTHPGAPMVHHGPHACL